MTDAGPVRGVVKDDMNQFLGIPYAAPPVGTLRWKPPQPATGWSGVRNADAYGNTCAQNITREGFAAPSDHEDCLFLNVQTPRTPGTNRPVMVWIHGGGLFMGSSNDYDPKWLVTDGDVVFVSMNYRLNIFGFFSHAALNAEGTAAGNYGVMDQQSALRWVQRNIAAFGGDPKNVTIFGESGGGMSVWAQLASPGSAGLFHKAIIESGTGTPTDLTPTLRSQEPSGKGFADAAGCQGQTAACLRSLSTQAILAANAPATGAQGSVSVPGVGGVTGLPRFRTALMADGQVMPEPARTLFSTGRFNQVPMINGTNRDEQMWFQALTALRTKKPVRAVDYPAQLMAMFGPDIGPKVLSLYPLSGYESPDNALGAALGDRGFICDGNRRATRLIKRHVAEVYAYEFDVPDTPIAWPPVEFPYQSAHTAEIQYLFPQFRGASGEAKKLDAGQQRLSRQMVRYWTSFARTGKPAGGVDGSPEWAKYESGADNYLSLGVPSPVMRDRFGDTHHCDFWDQVDGAQR